MPKISILMSVHNDAPYLQQTLDSIFQQSFRDFECIIINDASTDATPQILDRIEDNRLIRLDNAENQGLTLSLNKGLARANGEYIARFDGDDIATLNRLQKQLDFMEAHPEIGMLAGNVIRIDSQGNFLYGGKPMHDHHAPHGYLKWLLLWINRIDHNTVMFRHAVLREHDLQYDPAYNTAEDHEMWARLAHTTRLYRAQEIMGYRRLNPAGVSLNRRAEQLSIQFKVVQRENNLLMGYPVNPAILHTFFKIVQPDYERPLSPLPMQTAAFLLESHRAYLAQHQLSPEEQSLIHGELIGYLIRNARFASTENRFKALGALWYLQSLSKREFFSVNNFKFILNILFSH